MNAKPLRALTPLQLDCLHLLADRGSDDDPAARDVALAELWKLAEKLEPGADQKRIARQTRAALDRLDAEGVLAWCLDNGERYSIARTLPAVCRIELLFSLTLDPARLARPRKKTHASSKQVEGRQSEHQRGGAAVDHQPQAGGEGTSAPEPLGPGREGGTAGPEQPAPGTAESAPSDNAQPVLARTDDANDPEHVPNEPGANGAVSRRDDDDDGRFPDPLRERDSFPRPGQEAPATTGKENDQ